MDEKEKNVLIVAAFALLLIFNVINAIAIEEIKSDVRVLDVLDTKQGTRIENLEKFVGMESPSEFETNVWDVEYEDDGFTMTKVDRVMDDILVSEGAKYVIVEDENTGDMHVVMKVNDKWVEASYYFMPDDADEMNVVIKK